MRRAVLLAVVALAGCGSDSGGDKDAYVRDGNAICSRYQAAIAKLGQPDTLGELGPFIVKALPVLTRTVSAVEKLDPPGDLRDAFEKFRDAAGKTVDRARALQAAANSGDGEEAKRLLAEATAASEDRKKLARDAGLETCAAL